MKTDFDTLRALARHIVNHLVEHKIIEYAVSNRQQIIEDLAVELNVSFSTDEDIKDQAIAEVEDKLGHDNIPEEITESEMYNHARKEIIKSFQGEGLAGLYMVESLHKVANRIKEFLFDCEMIEDIFATDDELIDFLVDKIRRFSGR